MRIFIYYGVARSSFLKALTAPITDFLAFRGVADVVEKCNSIIGQPVASIPLGWDLI